jgi:hypothetical protein
MELLIVAALLALVLFVLGASDRSSDARTVRADGRSAERSPKQR